jgi:general secretion pathway protein I
MTSQSYCGADLLCCKRARDPHVRSSTFRSLARLRLASRLPRDAFRGHVRAYPLQNTAGFSLLEVLVAFVILTIVAGTLFKIFSGALANASAAEDYSRAVLVAESVLAETASAKPLREGTSEGRADGGRIQWTARVAAYAPPDVPPDLEAQAQAIATRLFRVSVDVAFPAPTGGTRTVALATTRIGVRETLQ